MGRFLYPIIAFICLIGLGEYVLLSMKIDAKDKETIALNSTSFSIAQSIQKQVMSGATATSMLELMLRTNNFNTRKFDQWAKEILKVSPHIETLQLAPNGVVKNIYPMNDHKKAIGHNLLADPNRQKGAMEALKSNKVMFAGPLRLIQNNRVAVIARKPISKLSYNKKQFWGFSTSIIYIEEIIQNAFEGLDTSNIAYVLYGSNPDFPESSIISQSEIDVSEDVKIYPIKVPNGEWFLAINYIEQVTFKERLFHLIVFLASMVIAIIIFFFERRNYKQALELELLNASLEQIANTDILTNLPNRRSAMRFTKKQLALSKRQHKDFCLSFFDLDHFKKLNDTYGHETGDLALRHFATLCEENIRESDLIARWGGEEFLLVLPMTSAQGAYTICENLRNLLQEHPLELKDKTIKMSVSIGVTILKNSDNNLDDLLHRADQALYEAKRKGRNQTIIA